jgi:hypothetical protein
MSRFLGLVGETLLVPLGVEAANRGVGRYPVALLASLASWGLGEAFVTEFGPGARWTIPVMQVAASVSLARSARH